MKDKSMNFEALVSVIEQTHLHFQQQAAKAVNVSLTIRNWLIGFYIVEFEQKGEDRAKYGAGLLNKLAVQLNIKGLVSAELSRCRQFYHCYPQIFGALTQEFKHLIPYPILGALTKKLIVKSMYAFEFLGLKDKDAVEENDLETALLDHLQEFMLEMGHGFCLEARQKKILIGDEYFFIDLVFYHRVLKCHVLIELKVEDFNHHNIGQLNTYVNYYKAKVMLPDDNPTIGILLVTDKNNALVEFATASMDNQLFVSKYLLELPKKEQLEAFILNELKAWK